MAVKGAEVFRDWFAGHRDKYVLIGGTAADSIMGAEGLTFRATKDLDIVLVVEALTPDFGQSFWAFIEAGGYAARESGDSGKATFYRFKNPTDDSFPTMVELFARAPDLIPPIAAGHLTPIPFDESISSLSAILLDDAYYTFILEGRRELNGIPMIGEDRLIPLKALAWLELNERRAAGEKIDSKDVRKHLNDVLRLSQLLTDESAIALDDRLTSDMRRFLEQAAGESADLKALGFTRANTLADLLARIGRAFGVSSEPAGS